MGDVPYVAPERTTVNGVLVFFLPVPGLMHANLIFRVGLADETLPCRGITHLVEHMALHSQANRSDWWRSTGTVDAFVTRFSFRGEPHDISTFLFEVTSSLSELPMDRLRAEKAMLRTEAANIGPGSIRRCGATDSELEVLVSQTIWSSGSDVWPRPKSELGPRNDSVRAMRHCGSAAHYPRTST
jgi:hypothetical protein